MTRSIRLTLYASLLAAGLWLASDRPVTSLPEATRPSVLPHGSDSPLAQYSGKGDWEASAHSAPQVLGVPLALPDLPGTETLTPSGGAAPNSAKTPWTWISALSKGLADGDARLRRSILEQALPVHVALADTAEEGDSTNRTFLEDIERELINSAGRESDPMLIEDHYLPFLAALSPDAAQPVMEHLLSTPLPGETLAAIIETLVDNALWNPKQAWAWINETQLDEQNRAELLSGLRAAYPEGSFDEPPPTQS